MMCKANKPLIVGQAPGRGADGCVPFSEGPTLRRMADLCGVSRDEFPAMFDLVNLIDYWPGRAGDGDAFPMAEARERAAAMSVAGRPLVLLAGRAVERAFGLRRGDWFEVRDLRGAPCAVVPHPSGRNRWWNDARRVADGRLAMRRVMVRYVHD
jgi:uracil-DNA glycosylase